MADCSDLITLDDQRNAKLDAASSSEYVSSDNPTLTTRLGKVKKTVQGMNADAQTALDNFEDAAGIALAAAGYPIIGDFSDAVKVEITNPNQVYSSKSIVGFEDGLYRYLGGLPYTPTETEPNSNWASVALGELKSAALAVGTNYLNIMYDTDLTTPIVGYIYSPSQSTTYSVPSAAQGKTILTVVDDLLTTSDLAEYTLETAEKSALELTTAEAIASTTLKLGDVVKASDRGNGEFKAVLASTVTPNTFDIIACTGKPTLALKLIVTENTNVAMFGAVGSGADDPLGAVESDVFLVAKERCKVEGYPLTLIGLRTYNLGGISFDVNILREQINTTGGVSVLKASALPVNYFCMLVGEYERGTGPDYSQRHLANKDVLTDVAIMGEESAAAWAVPGVRFGDGTLVTSLFSTRNLHISGFRWWGEFMDNSWSIKFYNLHTKYGGMKTPTSPADFGENMTFIAPFISDTLGETMEINRGEFTFVGGSIDNQYIVLNNDSMFKWENGHLENPGSSVTDENYVIANDESQFSAPGLSITMNDPGANITEPWFISGDGNPNGIDLTGCRYTLQSFYRPDAGSYNTLSLAAGGGAIHCGFASVTGYTNFNYIPVGEIIGKSLKNGKFERGYTKDWVATGTATFTTDTTIYKDGSKSVKILASPTNNGVLRNSIACSAGQKVMGGYWKKTELAAGGDSKGKLDFLDSDGVVLQTVSFASTTTTIDWTWFRMGGLAPDGTVEARVTLELSFTGTSGSVTGWFDGAVLNAV